jgi:Centromere kinetochore component CENP-T histone fold
MPNFVFSHNLQFFIRQRQTNSATTPFALAQKYLPRELLQDVRMALPLKVRSRQLERVEEEADEGYS